MERASRSCWGRFILRALGGRFPSQKCSKALLAALGVILVALGMLLAFLVRSWCDLGRSWAILGTQEAILHRFGVVWGSILMDVGSIRVDFIYFLIFLGGRALIRTANRAK